MSTSGKKDEDDDHPIRDPSNADGYRHEEGGGFRSRNPDTGTEWSRRRTPEGVGEDRSNR